MREPGKDRTWKGAVGFASIRDWLTNEGRLPAQHRPNRGEKKIPQRKHPEGPNVLWLMADQLRADVFGFAGHPSIKTPNLDRLASQGTICTRSYCSSPVCMPSRAVFLTGHTTEVNGVIQNGFPMNPSETAFPTMLREAGYRTANIGKTHCGRPPKKIFEYDEHVEDAFGATKPSKVPFDPANYPELKFVADEVCDISDRVLYGKYPGPVKTTKSYQLATRAMSWLYWNDDERPFFLRVSLDDPHPPVVPPEPFASMYSPDDVPGDLLAGYKESLATKPRIIKDLVRLTGKDKVSEEDHRIHAARYMGLVSHVDAQFGRILDYLEELGWADNTIVIVNADHGHMIGEHGLTHKGGQCYEGVAGIPTVVRWPGRIEPGTRVEGLIDGTDFMPTILDMLGVPSPSDLPGHSFLPMLEGKTQKIRDHAFVQWDDYGYGVIGERYKLVWWDSDNDGEMYDLSKDPREKVNIYHDPAYAETRDQLLEILDDWRKRFAHPRKDGVREHVLGGPQAGSIRRDEER